MEVTLDRWKWKVQVVGGDEVGRWLSVGNGTYWTPDDGFVKRETTVFRKPPTEKNVFTI